MCIRDRCQKVQTVHHRQKRTVCTSNNRIKHYDSGESVNLFIILMPSKIFPQYNHTLNTVSIISYFSKEFPLHSVYLFYGHSVYIYSGLHEGSHTRILVLTILPKVHPSLVDWFLGPLVTGMGNQSGISVGNASDGVMIWISRKHEPDG